MKSPVEIALIKAKEVIASEDLWIAGTRSAGEKHCAIGALDQALDSPYFYGESEPVYKSASTLLRTAADELFPYDVGYDSWNRSDPDSHRFLTLSGGYNDPKDNIGRICAVNNCLGWQAAMVMYGRAIELAENAKEESLG